MGSPDRFQLDDHFAAAKARSHAKPPGTIGAGGAIAGLVLLAGAIAATWWWALQPAPATAGDAHPLPTTVAERQGAVADQLDADGRGPRLGGETHEQYEARLARIRAREEAAAAQSGDAARDAQRQTEIDRGQAGRVGPAAGLPVAATARPAAASKAGLATPDQTAIWWARRVNERRQERAVHLRWLDACQKQHLVDFARAQIARASSGDGAHAAQIAAQNLAADIDTHQREARRIDALLTAAEQNLANYCASHAQAVPALDDPPTTADGRRPEPRPLPAPTAAAP